MGLWSAIRRVGQPRWDSGQPSGGWASHEGTMASHQVGGPATMGLWPLRFVISLLSELAMLFVMIKLIAFCLVL